VTDGKPERSTVRYSPAHKLLILAAAVACAALSTASQTDRRARLVPCQIKDVQGDVRCGTIQVPENRSSRSGRAIDLNVLVLAAAGAPRADPMVVLQGGPGQGASGLADFYGRLLADVRTERDIVLVDVRGTGQSNPLNCDLQPQGRTTADLLPVESVRRCRAALESRADLHQYTTSAIVADLEDVRIALGYERLNIYGTSYGTRVALEYLRRHPTGVRTLTLKGVVPPSDTMPATHARQGQEALEQVLARCEADAACRGTFPDVRAQLEKLTVRLQREPVHAPAKTPEGKPVGVTITADLFGEALRNMLYSPETAAQVPLLIDHAASGDWSDVAILVERTTRVFEGALAAGMFLSVTCTEDVPFIDPGTVVPAGLFGDFRVRQQQRACDAWVRGPMPADFHSPVRSDRPALLISGELDPVTGPARAAEVAQTLPNALEVRAPNNGHPMGRLLPCARRMIGDFVQKGTAVGLDTACAGTLDPVPFVLR
jgi:pimeloyl-ACP methyl ester carboxylesterase